MSLLSQRWQLHDVDDVEDMCESIAANSGLTLSHHERESLVTYLIETCWELSERFDPARFDSFRKFARINLSRRTYDWVRQYRGRTRWSFGNGYVLERPRVQLLSLDVASRDSLERAHASNGGHAAADRESDRRWLEDQRDLHRDWDYAELRTRPPRARAR